MLASLEGDAETALRLAGAGAALRDETGAPRGAADQRELDAALEPARAALGELATASWEAGRTEPLEHSFETAFAYLADSPFKKAHATRPTDALPG